MEKKLRITEDYLYLPIVKEQETALLEIYASDGETEKLFEFQIPVGSEKDGHYPADYYARFPVKKFTDKTLILKGDMPEAFFDAVENAPWRESAESLRHPSIHFAPETGWMNDPNGLVYKDGVYHLYFQYNPFDTCWGNMSWGHAVSRDLLYWEQKDAVLFPDETGTIFSGSGIVNERACLSLPAEALLFFYTAAGGTNPWSKGKESVQRAAYSVDGGETLEKLGDEGSLTAVCRENRDPKVFWHEKSGAYIMVLWLEENDFGIFRSSDLKEWEQSDRLTLDGAFECPDLIEVFDGHGNGHWMFWCADGYYFWGTFDGWCFQTDGVRHRAYMNGIPYAAQTYAGIEGRVVQIPWLRLPNGGRLYTGAMGLPRELSVRKREGEMLLVQKPVREFAQWKKEHAAVKKYADEVLEIECVFADGGEEPFVVEKTGEVYCFRVRETKGSYDRASGSFTVGEETCVLGADIRGFSFLVDDVILEVTADCDTIIGAFALENADGR